jgi:disulfide bond formation protein DsbB
LFKVWEACGYTPELLFGITMAEGLVVISAVLVLLTAVMTLASLLAGNKSA